MATIYCLEIETKKLKWLDSVIDRDYSIDDHVKIKNQLHWSQVDFETLKTKSVGWDTFYSKKKIDSEPHFHDGAEHRVILSGKGTFFVPIDTELYVINVEIGDYIFLRPKLVHWFTGKKKLLVARFFEGDLEHRAKMKDIPHEIYKLRDECVIDFKMEI